MSQEQPPAAEKLNVEFARRLAEQGASPVDVLVETEIGAAQEVADQLVQIEGVQLGSAGIVSPGFVSATLPAELLNQVASIDSVVKIHQDQLVGIKDRGDPLPQLPGLRPDSRPIRQAISEFAFSAAGGEDKYVGQVGISDVEVPQVNLAQLPPGNPVQAIASATDHVFDLGITGEEYVPTKRSVDWMLDGTATEGASGEQTKLAVIDTGHTPLPPSNNGRTPVMESMVPGEPAIDFLGHGSWCTYTAVGGSAPSTWGQCRGVAPGAEYAHFKALNSFPGFGKTSWIMKAMNRANEWGADVISMSLGGTQQGPIDEDPYCRFIRRRCKQNMGTEDGSIFVVAAGNSGPARWEIGSPGVSEKALTVGAWSLKDEAPSFYSSRGPQGDWYRDHPQRFEEDLGEYESSEFIKPDVTAPGGGRETQAKNDEEGELLHQTATGWVEGLYDGIKDGRGLMKGTCLAPDTQVIDKYGRPVLIKDVCEGMEVLTYDDGEMVPREVNAQMKNGIQQVYDVTIGGEQLTATDNHPFLCVDHGGNVEWKQLGQMDTDDRVVTNKRLPDNGSPMSLGASADGGAVVLDSEWDRPGMINGEIPEKTTDAFMRAVGFFVGDGWINEQDGTRAIMLAAGEHAEIDDRYVATFEDVFDVEMKTRVQDGREMCYYAASKRVAELFRRLNLDHGVYEKRVPPWVYGLPRSQQKAFIEGLIDSDGWVTERKRADQYGIELTSERLIRGAHRLVQNIGWKTSGIESRVRKIEPPNSNAPVKAETWKFTFHKTYYKTGATHAGRADIDFDRFQVRPVRSIEPAGEEMVYDIEVDGSHNFLANGCVVHNSMACPHVAGFVARLYEAGVIRNAAEIKQVTAEQSSVVPYPDAAEPANETVEGKNIAVGNGPIRESVFSA